MSKQERLEETMRLAQEGFSSSGIAKRVGVTQSTVQKYMDEIEETHGIEALL